MVFGLDPIQCRVKWRNQGQRERVGALRTNYAKSRRYVTIFPPTTVKLNNSLCCIITIVVTLVLQSSTYKDGLDTLDDPECNLEDHTYFYFVDDWPNMDVTRGCG